MLLCTSWNSFSECLRSSIGAARVSSRTGALRALLATIAAGSFSLRSLQLARAFCCAGRMHCYLQFPMRCVSAAPPTSSALCGVDWPTFGEARPARTYFKTLLPLCPPQQTDGELCQSLLFLVHCSGADLSWMPCGRPGAAGVDNGGIEALVHSKSWPLTRWRWRLLPWCRGPLAKLHLHLFRSTRALDSSRKERMQ